ncbi:hypothetical protein ACEWY4_026464 [Coilia grayii]|uniref:SCAN box domain-containing protein n=1 Tax=Coilia grayii TaxID=363190 RepID=A0ABD1IUY5_9TELE
MASFVEAFVAEPSREVLHNCTKEQLVLISDHYEVELSNKEKKTKSSLLMHLKSKLLEKGILTSAGLSVPNESPLSCTASEIRLKELELQEKQMALDTAKLHAEREALAFKERELEKQLELKRLEFEREREREQLANEREAREYERVQLARELELKERERQFELRKLELELAAKQPPIPLHSPSAHTPSAPPFDITRNIKMVPPFSEQDVDRYFHHFERVAMSLKWPRETWTLLLQCVLVGRAQDVYSSLSIEQSLSYDIVKSAILRAYELVPEAYRQRFRSVKKPDEHTYVEFAREKEHLFNRWCGSQKADSMELLRQLVLLEEFKSCVPEAVATYLNEQKVSTLSEAAVLADEFVLTHKDLQRGWRGAQGGYRSPLFEGKPRASDVSTDPGSPPRSYPGSPQSSTDSPQSNTIICFFCKKVGHKVAQCYALKNAKPVALAVTFPFRSGATRSTEECRVSEVKGNNGEGYSPFITWGTVSLPGQFNGRPVRVLRDTGAAQSFLVEGVLPLSQKTATGSHVLVRGFDRFVKVALHYILFSSDLMTGNVVVGVCSTLPVSGVEFILGNDLARGTVWASHTTVPLPVVSTPPEPVGSWGHFERPSDLLPACERSSATLSAEIKSLTPVLFARCERSLNDVSVQVTEEFTTQSVQSVERVCVNCQNVCKTVQADSMFESDCVENVDTHVESIQPMAEPSADGSLLVNHGVCGEVCKSWTPARDVFSFLVPMFHSQSSLGQFVPSIRLTPLCWLFRSLYSLLTWLLGVVLWPSYFAWTSVSWSTECKFNQHYTVCHLLQQAVILVLAECVLVDCFKFLYTISMYIDHNPPGF